MIGTLAGAFVLLAAAGSGSKAMADEIRLNITGDAGAAVSLDCRITRNGEVEHLTLEPEVPYEASFQASGIDCTITSDRQVTVMATKAGNVTRTTTSGGTTRLNLQ
jgi:hypothetical protein